MNKTMNNKYIYILMCVWIVLIAGGCSTTRRLAEGQILYTGVQRITIKSMTGEKVPSAIQSAIREPLNVRPNNALFSPYVRSPLPIGLWAYNAFYTERQTGFRAWMFRTFARPPVLMEETVQPELRMQLIENILDNHGYFNSRAEYEIVPQRNPRKARIRYYIDVAPPWYYSNTEFPAVRNDVTREIRSLTPRTKLHVGDRYDIDTLSDERVRITNALRNDSYYYFRPDYIEYLADTTQAPQKVDLRMVMASQIPEAALRPYTIGDVDVRIYSANGRGRVVDTIYNNVKIWYQKPLKIRPNILKRTLTIAPGQPASVDNINQTLTNFSRLGIFRYVNMNVTPLDSLKPEDTTIDMTLSMAMALPLDAELETDFSSKSNGFIGPGITFGVRNRNFLHGGEIFTIRLNANYEWQTRNTRSLPNSSTINSYELGTTASLVFPRLLAPGFIRRNKFETRTSFRFGANLLNRPNFFRMLSLDFSTEYDFQTSPTSFHNLTILKFVYNRLLTTTAAFDDILASNPVLRRSFENRLIPSASYTYRFDKHVGHHGRDRIIWQTTAISAGNLLAATYGMFGAKVPKKIFGNQFSQFIKGETELRYFKQIGEKNTLASRLLVGAAHAYGNSDVVPYTEQFGIGGAYSIRAFTIRSIGPGSFRPDPDNIHGFFDQVGTFKLEANVEYRFPIFNQLHGAVFLDAGNIWLLEDDPERPGGKLTAKHFFNEVALGTGVGLRYDLGFLVIRADLGIALHTPYANPDKPGHYNISSFRDGLGFHLAIGYPF